VPYIREDQADIRVSVDGVPYGDSWASVEGGNLEADDAKTRPGGMGREVAVGGPASRDDLTVATQMSDVTAPWVPRLEARVGVGAVKVGITYLGPERTPVGQPRTTVGILKAVNTPDQASDSSDVGMLELVVSCHEQGA
jgi:hypothetical protein